MSLIPFFFTKNYLSNSTSALQCSTIIIPFNYIHMSFKEDVVKRVLGNPGWLQEWKPSHPRHSPTPSPSSLTLWFPVHQTTHKSPRTLDPNHCFPIPSSPGGRLTQIPGASCPPPSPSLRQLCPRPLGAFLPFRFLPAVSTEARRATSLPHQLLLPFLQLPLSRPPAMLPSSTNPPSSRRFSLVSPWAPPLTLVGVESLGPSLHRHCWQQEKDNVRNTGHGPHWLLKSTCWSLTRRTSEHDLIWKWSCCRWH